MTPIAILLVLLAFIGPASQGSDANDALATTHTITPDANGDNAAPLPDFDGDGTVGFSDFIIFAEAFGSGQGDEKYDARYDLNDDGEIGFSDFVTFAQNFGKVVPSPVVSIPDANLRAAIETALGKASGTPITQADMATLTELPIPGAGIIDLTGLEFAANLVLLDLNYNYAITDISPLSGLSNLKTFTLGCNRFTDLSPLSGLTNLTDLNIGGNGFTDISSLSGLTNLKRLHLGNNDLTDISPLTDLINLTELGLGGNDLTDISPLAALTDLTRLVLIDNDITDVSLLAALTNLTYLDLRGNNIRDISSLPDFDGQWPTTLWLDGNDITDISSLAGMTNLRHLYLNDNNITDIPRLERLTHLTRLELGSNHITDISSLAGMTNLWRLELGFNDITDISSLAGLTELKIADFKFNDITDIPSLAGLANLTRLDLRGNPLNDTSINGRITSLESNGVRVLFDSLSKGDFDVELVFLDQFPERWKNVIQYAARRWMSVIVEDLPDYTLTRGHSGTCGGRSYNIPSGERIDDLRIYVSTSVSSTFAIAQGGPHLLRENSHLPVVGCMSFRLKSMSHALGAGLHEMGHVLGFERTVWELHDFLHDLSWSDSSADTHFNGPKAIAAFDGAGGRDYRGKKVPVEKRDGSHWRFNVDVLDDELMLAAGGDVLSAITVQSLADLGYGVDVTQADATAGKTAAKIASYQPSAPGPVLDLTLPTISPLRNADLYGQGRVWDGPSLGTAPAGAWTCGAARMDEPIYVIDSQGNIVRTITR